MKKIGELFHLFVTIGRSCVICVIDRHLQPATHSMIDLLQTSSGSQSDMKLPQSKPPKQLQNVGEIPISFTIPTSSNKNPEKTKQQIDTKQNQPTNPWLHPMRPTIREDRDAQSLRRFKAALASQDEARRSLGGPNIVKWINGSHLKMDGWNTSFLLGWPIFRGYVSFRECRS